MNIINFPSILQNFGKNVNFGKFKNNCRVNSEICVFVSTYPYNMTVLFHTFFLTLGKVTDSQSFKNKEYSVNCAKLFLRSIVIMSSLFSSRRMLSISKGVIPYSYGFFYFCELFFWIYSNFYNTSISNFIILYFYLDVINIFRNCI